MMKRFKLFFALIMMLTSVAITSCTQTSKLENTPEYVDDPVITAKVKAAIVKEPSLKFAEINVETIKGIVQLSGYVSGLPSISKASEVARRVNGVTLVNNDLRVR
jgi:osmotically-inducible protein OsmY